MERLQIFLLQILFWASGAVFCYPMEKRKNFWHRVFIFGVIVIIVSLFFLFFMGKGDLQLEVLAKNFYSILVFFFVYICWEVSWSVALYNSIWSISLWQLLLEVWKILREIGKFWVKDSALREIFVLLLLYTIGYLTCIKTIAEWMPQDRKKKIGPRQTGSAVLLFMIIEMLSYTPSMQNVSLYDEDWKFMYLSQMMCIVILYLQNELFKKGDIKQELALMNLLWKKEQEHYQLIKENIALTNQKYHDLKHQIRALRQASKEEYNKYLDEMEGTIRIYEAIVKTGNEVFDTILTEKSLYCKDRGIQVSCVADGSQMEFINTVDLYALLGNAMDNAIEAVEKFQEVEKRQIDVMIYRQQKFLVINIINPIPEKLVYEEELPVTTKGDKKFHGFGLRSIKYIVKKYDGFLTINEEDGCFSLKILMPIPSGAIK